jgi:hypothetical protein
VDKNWMAVEADVSPGVIPHQHGKLQPALYWSKSNTRDSASSGDKVGRGVQTIVGGTVVVGSTVGDQVSVALGKWVALGR